MSRVCATSPARGAGRLGSVFSAVVLSEGKASMIGGMSWVLQWE
ncbi:MAG: hypothetical protein K0S45_1094 [Nitrospira sp.]|nr:hypothetical protein [Nitrospira sp.]